MVGGVGAVSFLAELQDVITLGFERSAGLPSLGLPHPLGRPVGSIVPRGFPCLLPRTPLHVQKSFSLASDGLVCDNACEKSASAVLKSAISSHI